MLFIQCCYPDIAEAGAQFETPSVYGAHTPFAGSYTERLSMHQQHIEMPSYLEGVCAGCESEHDKQIAKDSATMNPYLFIEGIPNPMHSLIPTSHILMGSRTSEFKSLERYFLHSAFVP